MPITRCVSALTVVSSLLVGIVLDVLLLCAAQFSHVEGDTVHLFNEAMEPATIVCSDDEQRKYLGRLLSDAETYFVNSGVVKVVSVERQGQMMGEIDKQQGGGFDPRYMERSRQLGAKYFLTGKVFSADERTSDARRVQYFMFMQLIEVGTSAVVWQNKTQFTKALVAE